MVRMTLQPPEIPKSNDGFTLIELMVVVGIVMVLSAIGFVSISARIKTSRLESAVQGVVSDLSYARTTAMLKGCPTRFIFCQDSTCTNPTSMAVSNDRIAYSGASARFYGLLRMSQATDANAICFNSNAITSDAWANWDLDKKAVGLPSGVSFFGIYPSSGPAQGNWTSFSSSEATNSIYFETDGDLRVPLTDTTANAVGSSMAYRVVFQLGFDDCDPTDEDCLGYLVGIPANGGTAKFFRCDASGPRGSGTAYSNKCW